MNNKAKDNKWYIIYAKSSQVKEEWMNAFQRERKYVEEDEQKGYFTSSVCIRANPVYNPHRNILFTVNLVG